MSITTYLKNVKAETKHINWPTRHQALVYTGLVIAISLLTAAYLGALDQLFTHVFERLFL